MDPPEFEIAPGVFVGGNHPVFIIAEIGQNHQGSYLEATRLVQTAAECGVHCVAFHRSDVESRFTQKDLNRIYENEQSFGATYGDHMRALEILDENLINLKRFAEELGLIFTATGMDKMSIDFLQQIGVPFFKIDSADAANLPFLWYVSRYNKPLVISTGMTNEEELSRAYHEIKSATNIAMLQCTSSVPVPSCSVNLNVMQAYKNLYPRAVIGYSDGGNKVVESVAAVSIGAKIIEGRITFDHCLKGSDHASSLDESELRYFVQSIKKVEEAMGNKKKEIQVCECDSYDEETKTIVATGSIARGTCISEEHMAIKISTRKGYEPLCFDDLLGKRLKNAIALDEPFLPSHFD
ncbi:sialic acid synthase-like [Argiope bruennichi]|uniref:sialic acid synthase-like n=1 Tax=Argiope bruennichi TaxID=94029 RepID=UPI0024949B78|nr:sialic acid synthase-like [Argiope bruennichi]